MILLLLDKNRVALLMRTLKGTRPLCGSPEERSELQNRQGYSVRRMRGNAGFGFVRRAQNVLCSGLHTMPWRSLWHFSCILILPSPLQLSQRIDES